LSKFFEPKIWEMQYNENILKFRVEWKG